MASVRRTSVVTFEKPDHSPCWLVKHGAVVGRSLLLGGHYFGEGVDFDVGIGSSWLVFDPERKQLCELARCVEPIWVATHDNVEHN